MKITRENYPYAAFALSAIAMAVILLLALITDAFACGGEQPPPFTLPFTAPALNHERSKP
ncbi:MAG: hypothetical protein NUV51_00665 [Sulfuricaulis sp.]|nr:hypothetical protein [Sulfuricaulis sp.]